MKIGGGTDLSSRAIDLFALRRGAVVTGNHSTGALAPVVLRKRIHRWHRLEADEGTEFLGRGRQEIAIGAHHGLGVSSLPEDRARVDRADRMRLEQEARHHAKVAAAAAQRPEEIGVLALAGRDETAVGQDDVRFEQVVDREAVLAREVPGAAAERQARDAGGRDDAEGHRQAERVGGVIDVARRAAGIDPYGSACRIHAHALHHREVDHQSVVAAAKAWAVVAAAADGDEQALVAAEVHRGDDVGDVHAARDQARPLVDHAVVKSTGGIVVGITWTDESSAKALLQGGNDLISHSSLSFMGSVVPTKDITNAGRGRTPLPQWNVKAPNK